MRDACGLGLPIPPGSTAALAVRSGVSRRRACIAIVLVLSMIACSTPRPVLYPNDHFKAVGQAVADRDIEECETMAKAAGADQQTGEAGEVATGTAVGAGVGAAGGAVGGAISGGPGIGAAIGAASGAVVGFLATIFGRRRSGPSPAYINFVDRCLHEKGYESTGWQ